MFFKVSLTERFFVEPKMVLLWQRKRQINDYTTVQKFVIGKICIYLFI